MVWTENIFLMIMNYEKFSGFITKPMADITNTIAGLYSLSVDSEQDVSIIVTNELKAGGKEPNEIRDYGFVKQRTIEDLDGHTWEIFYMDVSKLPSTTAIE